MSEQDRTQNDAWSGTWLGEQLRERTAMRYAGNCKCHNCQLVPRVMLDAAIAALVEARFALSAAEDLAEVGIIDAPEGAYRRVGELRRAALRSLGTVSPPTPAPA